MSDTQTQQEPSIEEILASIRRIISEDGEEGAAPAEGAAADAPAEPAAEVAAAAESADEPEDILELTERVDDNPAPVIEDEPSNALDSAPKKAVEPPMPAVKDEFADADSLVSEPTAQRTTDVLSRLAPREAGPTNDPLPIGNRTLEEIVREMMRPMLREWLDNYLPTIVERSVERELRRMSRRAEELH